MPLAPFPSDGCLWLLVVDFLDDFWICVVDSPLTGYLFLLLEELVPLLLRALLLFVVADAAAAVVVVEVPVSLGCFGRTNAFVCFSRYWSLHSAEINGRSMLRLFSRSVRMSSMPESFPSSFSSPLLPVLDLLGVDAGAADVQAADGKEADGNG